jgi:rhodanese-related sulfurtransferase
LGEFIINHWILSSLFVILLYLVFSDTLNRRLSGLQPINVSEVVNLVNQQKGCFIDVREEEAFAKAHIVDAINIPAGKLDEDLSKKLKKMDQPLVVVCDGGQKSRAAAKKLKTKGYTNVFVLSGGLHAWRDAKLPLFG